MDGEEADVSYDLYLRLLFPDKDNINETQFSILPEILVLHPEFPQDMEDMNMFGEQTMTLDSL